MTPNPANQITDELIAEVKRRLFDESLPRIRKCLDMLDDDQVWWRPNEESNSIGNLVLHLAGNVRQWILTGVARQPDTRERQEEFDARETLPKDELWEILNSVMDEVSPVIDDVKPEDLVALKPVQVYEESVLSILVHVTEHFSYHTGQIAWITKMLTSSDLGFYAGVDLG